MKAVLLLACAFTFSFHLHAQGTVNFANLAVGVDAPIYYSAPTLLGAESSPRGPWLAMLYAGPVGSPEAELKSDVVSGMPALAGFPTPGYFSGGVRTITGVPAGSQALLQIRVWNSSSGITWEAAVAGGSSDLGKSIPIVVTLGSGPTSTSSMAGLQSFEIVPEPSVCWMGVLASAVLILMRPRQCGRVFRETSLRAR